MSRVEAVAKSVGATAEQARELAAFLQVESVQTGTWKTTANGIITHTDGSRHWSSATCEQCS